MKSGRSNIAAVLVTIGALGAAALAVPFMATPASAEPYTATGTLTIPAPIGNPATDLEFATTCPDMPSNQGLDAWIFALPSEFAVAGTHVTVTDSPTNTHDLSAYIYKADCTFDRSWTDGAAGNDVDITLADGDTFISVFNTRGADVNLTLTATAGVGPTETASPTETVSPTPTGGGTRGEYPEDPDDPLFLQDGEDDLILAGQWGMRKVKAPQAWQEARGTGAGINVAVLDSGLDLGHPDFACDGKVDVVPGADPDPDGSTSPQDDVNGHGTHVAGIVGACTDNGVGVVGVAPDATIMPIQILSDTGGDADTLADAIRTATDEGAHVINMSIGFGIHDPLLGLTIPYTGTAAGFIGQLQVIDDAVEYAVSQGVVVVASAGNETAALCGYPAIAIDVVCVGSSDKNDVNSWFGNFPVKDDDEDLVGPGLLAPGGSGVIVFCDLSATEIISTYSRAADATEGNCDGLEGYATIQGTSMAAPHVSGAAALVYDRIGGTRSPANADKVIEALTMSAADLYAPGYDPASGYGRLDALEAVKYWPAAADPSPSGSTSVTPTPTPTTQATTVTIGAGVPATVQYADNLALTARLTDADGDAVVGETLTFQLQGDEGFREVSGTTGANGVASATLMADVVPGSYRVAVGYSGKTGVYESSSASQPIAVVREDSSTSLIVTVAQGSRRTLTATVRETDDPSRRLAGVTVEFYVDGLKVGEAVTNASGVASLTTKKGTAYQARFAGDVFYLPSTS